jgi:hypothetical protein
VTAITFWSFSEKKATKGWPKLEEGTDRVLRHRGAAHNPNDTMTIGALIHVKTSRAGQTCFLPSVRTPLPLR